MKQDVIDAVAAAGFDVYMRNARDTWLIFTDDTGRLGYLESPGGQAGCFNISTVHMLNTTTGTGFQVERYASSFDRDMLARAFVHAPNWASGRDVASVRKYRDIEHYRGRDSFNASYQLVAKGAR